MVPGTRILSPPPSLRENEKNAFSILYFVYSVVYKKWLSLSFCVESFLVVSFYLSSNQKILV